LEGTKLRITPAERAGSKPMAENFKRLFEKGKLGEFDTLNRIKYAAC
jgi:hypothetical protein